MATYTIIGGDGKEYGPVSGEDLRKWIAEGRLSAQSLAKAESDAAFRPLSAFPELADAFAPQAPMPGAPPVFSTAANLGEGDYELDIGGCLTCGWNLLKNNFGLLFVAVLIYNLIEGVVAGFGMIPFIGPLFSLANLVVVGPLMGGLIYIFLQTIRSQPASVGEVFIGFRKSFAQLFLGYLIPALLAGVWLIPAGIVAVICILPTITSHVAAHPSAGAVAIIVVAFLICLMAVFYLSTNWIFTLPLIMDKQMDFWPAMQTSWKMVNKHWWQVFGLIVLMGLLNIAGLLACCVGIFFTIPIGLGAWMYAYETIFSRPQTG
jgi:uncharacterized membrane protein